MFWRKKEFRKEIKFVCKLPEDARILVFTPTNPIALSFSIPVIYSLSRYFKKNPHIFVLEEDYEIFFRFFIRDAILLLDSRDRKKIVERINREERVDIIIDLNYPESPWHKYNFNKDYRVAISERVPGSFNIVFNPVSKSIDGVYRGILGTFNIPEEVPAFSVTKKEKSKAFEFAKYKGHREENFLIFVDVGGKRKSEIKQILTTITGGKATIFDFDLLHMLDLKEKMALLSISDLFIAGNSLYVWPAQVFKVKTYLLRREKEGIPLREGKYLIFEKKDVAKELKNILEKSA